MENRKQMIARVVDTMLRGGTLFSCSFGEEKKRKPG
jgi:hypothetical protein